VTHFDVIQHHQSIIAESERTAKRKSALLPDLPDGTKSLHFLWKLSSAGAIIPRLYNLRRIAAFLKTIDCVHRRISDG